MARESRIRRHHQDPRASAHGGHSQLTLVDEAIVTMMWWRDSEIDRDTVEAEAFERFVRV